MERIADDLLGVVAVEHQVGALGLHVGEHVEDQRQTLAAARLGQERLHKRLGGGAGLVGHVGGLADAELDVAAAERLEVRAEHILRRAARQVGTCLKHLLGVGLDVLARQRGQRLGGGFVLRGGRRRAEHQRIGQNGRQQQTRDLAAGRQALFAVHLVQNRGRAAHRNIAEIDRAGGLQTADAVMVDDLQNVRLLQTVHGLGALIVVNENDLLAVQVQQVTAADDAAVLAVLIQNREIAVTHAGHNLFGVLNRRIYAEFQQFLRAHKVAHRRGGGDEPRGGVGIVGGRQHGAALFLRTCHDGARHRGAAADNDGLRAAVDGAHLGLVPVGDQHKVAGLDELLHDFRAGADADIAAVNVGVGAADHQLSLQRFQQVRAAGVGRGQHCRVEQVHVRVGNVFDGDKPLQLVVAVHDAERVDLDVAHQVPGRAQAHLAVDARLLADVDVLDLRADVGAKPRRLHAEVLQNEPRFPVHMSGAAGLIQAGQAAAVFQPGIRQRGADRVRVRVLVADDVDVAYRVVCHSGSPSYTLFPSSSRPCLPLGGRCPEGAEGENLAIARSLLTWPGSLPHPLRREPPPRGGQGECKAVWFN